MSNYTILEKRTRVLFLFFAVYDCRIQLRFKFRCIKLEQKYCNQIMEFDEIKKILFKIALKVLPFASINVINYK